MADQSKALKEKLLAMMSWFHDFCVENNIRYYAVGGTLLGAVRHGGFIPWDDDMDLGVPRPDYERLIRLMSNEPSCKYLLESQYSKSPEYMYPHSKLYDTSTTLIENTKRPIKRGICIDIFPIDGIGNSEAEALRNFKRIGFLLNIHTACTVKMKKNRSLVKNLIVAAMSPVSLLIDPKKLALKITRECMKRDYTTSSYSGDLVGRYRAKEIVPTSWFGNPTLYQFESITIFGPEKYDEYLTNVYGNWKELPPIEKRKAMHNVQYMNLDQSFLSGEKNC